MPTTPWLAIPQPRPTARTQLVCLAHAGATGSSAFADWPARFPDSVELRFIEPPGRWGRTREPPFTRMEPLVDALATALVPTLDRPFALFGYSLGALVAFELARALRDRGCPPSRLLVAARVAPRESTRFATDLHRLPDGALVEEVVRHYDGFPRAALESEELLRLLVPIVRADLEVLETYEYLPAPPLECPIVAYGGDADWMTPVAALRGWGDETRGGFATRVFRGGHFFLHNELGAVVDDVIERIEPRMGFGA